MWAWIRSFEREGLLLRGAVGRKIRTLGWDEILGAERHPSGFWFRLHVTSGDPVTVMVRRGRMRNVERQLRTAGVRMVDEYGARIDDSQFAKEADPEFVRRSVREYKRSVGQWSDDA